MNNSFGDAKPGDFAPPIHSMDPGPPPVEHRTVAPKGAAPATVAYEGGGIFAASTPGPSMDAPEEPRVPPPQGYNFGPSAVPLPAQAPMPGMPGPPLRLPQRQMHPTMMDELGDFEHEAGHTLGISILGIVAGAAIGTYYGGPFGGLAGSLFAGAGINAYRAMKYYTAGTDDSEAKVSGTYAVVSAAAGGALWYYFVSERQQKPMRRNASKRSGGRRDYKEFSQNAPDDCNIRPVGP